MSISTDLTPPGLDSPVELPPTTGDEAKVDSQRSAKRRYTMILPEAYDERAMPSLKLARSSRRARLIGRTLAFLIVAGFFVVLIAPWQQSVRGTGSVIAFKPRDRPQTIQSPIKGRIESFGEGIFENAHVKKGDVIVEIRDLDEMFLGRLGSELDAVTDQIRNLENVVAQGRASLLNAKAMEATIDAQVQSYMNVKEQVIAAAEAGINDAEFKVESQEQKLEEVRATLVAAKADYRRQKTLYNEKIASELKFQEAERKNDEAEAKVKQAIADVSSAKAALLEKREERIGKEAKAQAEVEYAESLRDKARGDVNKAEGDIAKSSSELNKAAKELLSTESKQARQGEQTILAPFDGVLTQIMPNQGSAMLKEGDPICVIVPDTADLAVEVWLDGNDAPLVSTGRHVRLQFEGWPAVQFAGWPSVAVGTFAGQVVSVDATDNGKGKFRVLVQPEDESDWPEDRFLRQGVLANGWVLLEQVPLWFEIWRNLNGFPPMLEEQTKEFGDDSKPPKVKL